MVFQQQCQQEQLNFLQATGKLSVSSDLLVVFSACALVYFVHWCFAYWSLAHYLYFKLGVCILGLGHICLLLILSWN